MQIVSSLPVSFIESWSMSYISDGTSKKQTCIWHGALQCFKGLHNEILIPLILPIPVTCQHINPPSLLILTDNTTFSFMWISQHNHFYYKDIICFYTKLLDVSNHMAWMGKGPWWTFKILVCMKEITSLQSVFITIILSGFLNHNTNV